MKDIKGFEGLYAVTKEGKVWSYPKKWRTGGNGSNTISFFHEGKWLKPTHNKVTGYFIVYLRKNRRVSTRSIHRLVAKAYIPNPKKLPEVNHKDTNKLNNKSTNLEWVTSKQNHEHARKHGLYPVGKQLHMTKLNPRKVRMIRKLRSKGTPIKELSKRFGIVDSGISAICHRRYWKHVY